MSPFGKADYKVGLENKTINEEEVLPGKKKCEICGKIYTIKNSGKHRKTKYHMLCQNINSKMRDMILS